MLKWIIVFAIFLLQIIINKMPLWTILIPLLVLFRAIERDIRNSFTLGVFDGPTGTAALKSGSNEKRTDEPFMSEIGKTRVSVQPPTALENKSITICKPKAVDKKDDSPFGTV